jgi:hypothetical protein
LLIEMAPIASQKPLFGSALNWHGQPYEQLQLISSVPWISQGVMVVLLVLRDD